jgi:hypothetical protein
MGLFRAVPNGQSKKKQDKGISRKNMMNGKMKKGAKLEKEEERGQIKGE